MKYVTRIVSFFMLMLLTAFSSVYADTIFSGGSTASYGNGFPTASYSGNGGLSATYSANGVDPAPSYSGVNLPPGSYLQTCQSCSMSYSNLSCTCLDHNQNPFLSVLANASSCGYVVNNDGHLACQQKGGGYPVSLPPGSYLQTCQSCQFDGRQLSCQCQTKNQNWQFTSLYNAKNCSEIVNNDGSLQCANSSNQNNNQYLPPGSYSQTCRYCEYDGNQLSCQCRTRNNYWQSTLLYDAGLCSWIINHNGNLRCARPRGY